VNIKNSIIVHLRDFKSCLLFIILGLVFCSVISFTFSKEILYFLRISIVADFHYPIKFIVLSPQEYFYLQMKISLVSGSILSCPWSFFQIWSFITPGLYQSEKYYLLSFMYIGIFFFFFGALFGCFVVCPLIFKFFVSNLPVLVKGYYSMNMFFSFCIKIIFIFSVAFEVPVLICALVFFKLIKITLLLQIRKYVWVFSFVLAACLTPPDPISQLFLAIPCIFLYEGGILCSNILAKLKLC